MTEIVVGLSSANKPIEIHVAKLTFPSSRINTLVFKGGRKTKLLIYSEVPLKPQKPKIKMFCLSFHQLHTKVNYLSTMGSFYWQM